MEIPLSPEVERQLKIVASETGRPADQVIAELIIRYLEHDAWFRSEVDKGLASLSRGEVLSDDEVQHRINQILQS